MDNRVAHCLLKARAQNRGLADLIFSWDSQNKSKFYLIMKRSITIVEGSTGARTVHSS